MNLSTFDELAVKVRFELTEDRAVDNVRVMRSICLREISGVVVLRHSSKQIDD